MSDRLATKSIMTVNATCESANESMDTSSKGCCKLRDKILKRGRTGRGTNSSRAHKKNGNALKFHNFVANQNVASTRIATTHCLREEHGTKQITVSHWRKPIGNQVAPVTPIAPITPIPAAVNQDALPAESQKQSILESLLAKAGNIEKTKDSNDSHDHKVNKRKPLLIRRVLRKDECHEQSEPLDLSVKKRPKTDANQTIESSKNVSNMDMNGDSIDNLIKKVEQSAAEAASIIASVSGAPVMTSPIIAMSGDHRTFSLQRNMRPIQPKPSPNGQNFPCTNITQVVSTPFIATVEPKQYKQRNTQRGVIKQKLEETFRQNGFLVKTKQVSDGDATFCKFRQLRKYTRYYLKSWHQHLPDEVNKLWKGFLPPKSTKPSSSHKF